jgi:predicted amidohydrolase YtcJ
MQPLHATPTSDPRFTPWTMMAGAQREPYSFPWQMLLQAGARLAFGSDWPIVTPDIRAGIRAAVARTSSDGNPPGGWQPQLAITMAQALDAYTRAAAYVEGQERVKGVLRPGMAADITVFARDLFACTPAELPDVGIAATVVGGRPVHREV